MMIRPLLIVSCILPLASAVGAPPTTRPLIPLGGNWKLVFDDEFGGNERDLDANWISQNAPSTHILCSRWRENAKEENGTLKLINRKEKRGGQEWTSGNIWTKTWFKYGYFECRYRYAAAEGTNNSFWIMTQGPNPTQGKRFEIDINEGHYPNEVNTCIHNWSDVTLVNGYRAHPAYGRSFPIGLQASRVIQLEIPITTRRIRLVSDQEKHFHLREFRVYGTSTNGYPNILDKPGKDAPADFARDPATEITVSGFHQTKTPQSVKDLVDGDIDTAWISQPEGSKWVELEFAKPKTIGCVQFVSGWQGAPGDWHDSLSQYKVQYHNGTDWVDMSSFNLKEANIDFARDFHTLGLLWTDSELVFYLDGRELRREKNTFCYSPAPVWLSLAIIPWAGKITDAIDGTFMEVDYVRVFQREGSGAEVCLPESTTKPASPISATSKH